MKKFSKLLIAVTMVFFASCEKDDAVTKTEKTTTTQDRTGSRYMTYGDVVTMAYIPTLKFLTAESNGDATINKAWNTSVPSLNNVWLPWAKFRIVNPNDPSSTAEVKTGDEVAFKCLQNNLYMVAESWDDDVNVNRTAIGPWEKWKVYAPSNTTAGNSIFYSSTNYMAFVSIKSVWDKYLRADASGYAKAGGSFDPTINVMSNQNTFQLSKQ
ncbi:fascin domain-containing protein [Flavobacterium pedocola]